MTTRIDDISRQPESTRRTLLALNNLHAAETSLLTAEQWNHLIDLAFAARCIGDGAFLIALDHDAPYENPNFAWFHRRLARFAYVDRIVVAGTLRGSGVGRRLYDDLFEAVRHRGIGTVVSEVNIDPPNPASDMFHRTMGFAEMGRAVLADRGKVVRYLTCEVAGT